MIRAHVALALLMASALCARGAPHIDWVRSPERVAVEISGLDPAVLAAVRDWPEEKMRALLAVRVQQDDAPAMLGAWQADARVLRFTPQFPPTPGVAYRAVFDAARLPGADEKAKPLSSDFILPPPAPKSRTVVTQIFPSAEVVPENLLKFYVHFSAPMSRGHIYDHIHLRDEKGREVELPFLEIDEELWDPAMKRLTLFIDPGRIKRGVRPLEEIGPALEEGRRFILLIDPAWLDAGGQPLAEQYARTFRVGPPDRTPILPEHWKITAPRAGERAPLCITFPEPMDHALASRMIRVTRGDGSSVEGEVTLADAERSWRFAPVKPWRQGAHRLVIATTLEDLAGNNVGRAFEVDLRERGERLEFAASVTLPFEVADPPRR